MAFTKSDMTTKHLLFPAPPVVQAARRPQIGEPEIRRKVQGNVAAEYATLSSTKPHPQPFEPSVRGERGGAELQDQDGFGGHGGGGDAREGGDRRRRPQVPRRRHRQRHLHLQQVRLINLHSIHIKTIFEI